MAGSENRNKVKVNRAKLFELCLFVEGWAVEPKAQVIELRGCARAERAGAREKVEESRLEKVKLATALWSRQEPGRTQDLIRSHG